jgi:hypothetical protein
MSEYKYACPVCGQHMMCDSSQAGTVMECPTCFQKITAPQAPASDDPKFIITGTKVGERRIPSALANSGDAMAAPSAKKFPVAAVVCVILICVAAAAAFVFRGKIFKSGNSAGASGGWTLDLGAVTIPDALAAGRIHGQDFICDRALFQNGALTLRGTNNVSLVVGFSGASAATPAGQSINVATNTSSARVTLHWKEGGRNARENFDGGYAMRLEFGAAVNNHVPAKIYFCAPDDLKSFVTGTFNVEIRKPKPASTGS